ncbi:putative HC-toxin efflux carrier TOXA [Emericellopsis cladophorae]|uniref:HC-toxin efflux carrier TOXA n=1 Tax=Emericellopsis cladophorae TaxID=2686198 RepID=A0A9P9XTH9_9HYPO|nr:putative HC-toxin efflux carrier TOXA [Emericellopsis cladophorae]KAI6777586.1 putative HC-toxin efflux carrier TOXA [Emericellopsis cladophorae]
MSSHLHADSDAAPRQLGEKLPARDSSFLAGPDASMDAHVSAAADDNPVAAVKAVEQMSNTRWFSVCVGLYSTAFLYGLDTNISAAVQGSVLASLGGLPLLPWIGTGFMLGSLATISVLGSAYAKFEVKWLYLASILMFEVGSAVCGAAPNMQAMAVGRVVAGVGGSGIYLGGVNYISLFVSPARRPIYTALIGTFWGLGAVLGPVIGSAFAQSAATWRWAFYINLVFGAATAPIYIFWFPRNGAYGHKPILPRLWTLDRLGAILNAAMFSLLFTAGLEPISVAVRLLPLVCLIIFATMLCGALLPRFDVYAAWYTASGVTALAGGVLLARIDATTPTREMYGFEVLAGFGCGLTFQAAYAIALVKAPADKAASVLSFINVAQLGGAALSLAIAGSVFQNVGFHTMRSALDGRRYTSAEIHEALAGGYSRIITDSAPEVRALASEAIAATLGKVYVLSAVAAVLILLSGILMRWERLTLA